MHLMHLMHCEKHTKLRNLAQKSDAFDAFDAFLKKHKNSEYLPKKVQKIKIYVPVHTKRLFLSFMFD